MIRDAIGGTTNEECDGVQAALVNFRFLAHALWTTSHAVELLAEWHRPNYMAAPNAPDC